MRQPKLLRKICLLLALAAVCLMLAACEVEEEIKLNADGSGTYRARILVEKEVGDALKEVRGDAEKRGFKVVEEGETANRKFVAIAREFQNIAELNDKEDTYQLEIDRSSFFKSSYHLTLNFGGNPSASGFSRNVEVTMPAAVASTNVGTVTGKSVRWDCSHPGSLDVQAAGFALPLKGGQLRIILVVLVLGALLLVGIRIARRKPAPAPAQARCEKCGEPLAPGAKFCPKCGAQHGMPPLPDFKTTA